MHRARSEQRVIVGVVASAVGEDRGGEDETVSGICQCGSKGDGRSAVGDSDALPSDGRSAVGESDVLPFVPPPSPPPPGPPQ